MAGIPGVGAEAIIFAINSVIKISKNLRQIKAREIQEKKIVLPLPKFDPEIKPLTMFRFFNKLPEAQLRESERLWELHRKMKEERDLPEKELEVYRHYYRIYHSRQKGFTDYAKISRKDILSLFTIEGAEEGESVSVLQFVAGSLIEIGVDYFTQVPGALNRDSAHGRVLYHFLQAFEEIDFLSERDIKESFSEKLVPRLFAAAAESVADLSPEITENDGFQRLIKETAKGIANDLYLRVRERDALQREEAVQWGQLVLRSMIKNAGEFTLAAPGSLLGTNQGVSRIIEASGLILLENILPEDSDEVSFKNALNPDTLDRLTRAMLGVVAEHPEILSGKQAGVQEIVQGVSRALQQKEDLLQLQLLPELVRLVLEQSAGRLDLLWKTEGDKAEHLLVIAIGQVLEAISAEPENGGWKPRLTRTQLLGLTENLLDEVVRNPGWVLAEADKKPMLGAVIGATLQALSQIPADERLQPEVLEHLLQLSLETALSQPQVLDPIKWGSDEEESMLLKKALALICQVVFKKTEASRVQRLPLLVEMLEYVHTFILRRHPDQKGLLLTQLVLFDSGVDYRRGFRPELADQLLDAVLAVVEERPELVADPKPLQLILSGVTAALDSSDLQEPGLAARLIRLILKNTALQSHLFIEAEAGEARHLLVSALQQILSSLSVTDEDGKWDPALGPGQMEQLLVITLDEIVRHPYWLKKEVEEDALLAQLVDTTLEALAVLPPEERLTPETLELLLQLGLMTVAGSPQVLDKVGFGEEGQRKEILRHAIELVLAAVLAPETTPGPQILNELLEFAIDDLLRRYPDRRGLVLLDLILAENNGIDFSRGFPDEEVYRLLDSAAFVLAQEPELVSRDQLLKRLIGWLAAALEESGFQQPGLLRELIRLALETSAEHLEWLSDEARLEERHLFLPVATHTLRALARPAEEGPWRPRLSQDQLLGLVQLAYRAALRNPAWADTPLLELITAVVAALRRMPEPERLPYLLLRYYIERCLAAAEQEHELLLRVETGEGSKVLRLQLSLQAFVTTLYDEERQQEMHWQLSQQEVVQKLLDFFLLHLTAPGADTEQALEKLEAALDQWLEDLRQNLDDILLAI